MAICHKKRHSTNLPATYGRVMAKLFRINYFAMVDKDEREVIVTIRCITYNHEPYIRQAIEGFVMQKTDFRFEAIVHDDASTDKTAEIIKEYAEKYPDIIKPIYETENQYSKHDGSLRRIMNNATRGKYVAFCEGDDYWTDPLKLQKQVDFLESHPDYSMCFHNAMVHYENGNTENHLFAKLENREYQVEETVENWIVPTASILLRSSILSSSYYKRVGESKKLVVGDNPLIRCCGMSGKIYGFKDVMGVYRKQPGGWTENLNAGFLLKLIEQELEYTRIFGKRFAKYSKAGIARHSRGAISLLNKKEYRKCLIIWWYALRYAPVQSIIANFKYAIHLLQNGTAHNK